MENAEKRAQTEMRGGCAHPEFLKSCLDREPSWLFQSGVAHYFLTFPLGTTWKITYRTRGYLIRPINVSSSCDQVVTILIGLSSLFLSKELTNERMSSSLLVPRITEHLLSKTAYKPFFQISFYLKNGPPPPQNYLMKDSTASSKFITT